MSDLTKKPIWQLAELLKNKKASSEEICRSYLERVDLLNPELGAYLSVQHDQALAQARSADKRIAHGDNTAPLTGIPLAIKDILTTKGITTTCGSKILENFVPPFDGTAVNRLRAAGAVFLGKTNCDEFAMGSSNEYSAYKLARNPWNTERIPGGSSGGSAVAVSARLAAGALGTDTGGSVRQPASMCGIVGMKPTYGRVSRFGLVAFGSSLDTIGPMTRSVMDSAIILQTIAGYDRRDSTSLKNPVVEYSKELNENLKGLRIGIPVKSELEGLQEDVRIAFNSSLKILENEGAIIQEIRLPYFQYTIPAYYIVACAEASSNLARFDGIRYGLRKDDFTDLSDQYLKTRTAGFGLEVKRRIMLGTFVLSSGYYDAYYRKGIQVRELIKQGINQAFNSVDLIASPTSPTTAFKIGERIEDPIQMYLADIFTVTANLTGVPAISINCGFSKENLPIGFQFIAPHLQEGKALNAAFALEQILNLPADGPFD